MATWGRENVADCSESAGSTIGHDATLSLAALKRAYNAESEWAVQSATNPLCRPSPRRHACSVAWDDDLAARRLEHVISSYVSDGITIGYDAPHSRAALIHADNAGSE